MKSLLSSTSFLIVNKRLAKRVGLKEAILLSDLISKEQYFIENKMLDDGWFYNTSKNIEQDTTLSRHKQSVAIKNLIKEGFIKTDLRGVPATLHFKIMENKIVNFLKTRIEKNTKLDVKKLKTNNNKEIKITNKDISIRLKKFEEQVFNSNLSSELCQEFVDYWTETNSSGKKMKFEMQKTFDVKRRLARWVKNSKLWNKETKGVSQQVEIMQHVLNKIK
tara:strand:+ start:2249 stop:2908 length:660 start_codon:yes stop_codon:yes gene_type:complete